MSFPEKYINGELNPAYVTELEERYTYTQEAIKLLIDMVEDNSINPSNGATITINSIRRKVSDPLPEDMQMKAAEKSVFKPNISTP